MKRKMKHFVSLFLVLIFTLQLFAAVPASAIGTAEEPSDTLEEISVQKEAPEQSWANRSYPNRPPLR